jgi:hypothetical protein
MLEGMLEGMLEEGVDLALMRGLADDRWRIKAVSEHAPQQCQCLVHAEWSG